MTGRCYYITSVADWRRHAARFANSHWFALNDDATGRELVDASCAVRAETTNPVACESHLPGDTKIFVLVDADEGVHVALEDDSSFEALPHPLTQKSISDVARSALAAHGVAPGATTFDATEAVARAHPLLRHRVF